MGKVVLAYFDTAQKNFTGVTLYKTPMLGIGEFLPMTPK